MPLFALLAADPPPPSIINPLLCHTLVQVFNLTNCKLKANLAAHSGYINTVTVSPDGSLCASGGKVCLSKGHAVQR